MSGRMKRLAILSVAGCVGMTVWLGCSRIKAMMGQTGGSPGSAESRSRVFVSLDGMEAKVDAMEKAAKGHAIPKIKQPVGLSPTLRYRIEDPEYFGRISSVIGNIFQQFGDGYSSQAEFIILSRDFNDPQKRLKPDRDYDLGDPPPELMIRGRNNKELKSLKFKPHTKYRMNWVVSGDRSETAMLEFQTE